MDELSPEVAEWVIVDIFGRIFGCAGLTLLEREAIVVGSLLAQSAVKELATHRRAILHLGGHEGILDIILDDLKSLLPPACTCWPPMRWCVCGGSCR